MFSRLFRNRNSAASSGADRPIYAIGDIHGCADLLDGLLERIAANAGDLSAAQLIFLGDYVDRGPDSRAVLDRLITLKNEAPQTIVLKGNHEAVLLDFLAAPAETTHWLGWGGEETLESYGVQRVFTRPPEEVAEDFAARLPASHLTFLQSLALTHQQGDYLFVHAGLKPGVALKDQTEEDLLWIRKAFHQCPPDKRPPQIVVYGHTPIKAPLDAGWRIGIDTGACWSGKLTALAINGDQRFFIST